MSSSPGPPAAPGSRLAVSRYDRASSMLLSLLILLGAVVALLLITWLTSRIFVAPAAVPVELADVAGDGSLGDSKELEEPPAESYMEEVPLEDRLTALPTAVARLAPQLDDPSLGGGSGSGSGGGTGRGGGGTVRHWELRFQQGLTLEAYARQLDSFGIELGVLLPGNRVAYARNLAKPKPDTRNGPADQEKRYYLTWRQGELQQADMELLQRAGLDAKGRLILKLLPPEVEAQLAALEKAKAGREADNVEKTVFGIRAGGKNFEFFVVEQTYR